LMYFWIAINQSPFGLLRRQYLAHSTAAVMLFHSELPSSTASKPALQLVCVSLDTN